MKKTTTKNSEQLQGVNMQKPMTRELKQLEKRLQQIQREEIKIHTAMEKRLKSINRAAEAERKAAKREADKLAESFHKEHNALIHRQSIILGRLAS